MPRPGSTRRKQQSDRPKPSAAPPQMPGGRLPSAGWQDHWGVWIVLTAVVVRIVYFTQYVQSPLLGNFGADDLYYLRWAHEIAGGNWLGDEVFEQGPLYPYLLALLFLIFGRAVGFILVAQMLSGVLVSWLVYDAGRRLFDRPTSAVAGLLTALYGPLVFYECMVMKSFLSPLLTATAFGAAVRYRDSRRIHWPLLAGVSVGLACLVQENHALLLLPIMVWIWQCRGGLATRKLATAAHVAAPLLAAAVCILPVTWRNWYVGGQWVLVTSGGGEVFYMGHGPAARPFYNPPDFVVAAPGAEHEDFRREARRRTGQQMSRSEASSYWFREGLRAIATDPLRSLKLTLQKAAVLLGDYDVPDSQSYTAARQFLGLLKVLPSFGWVAGLGILGAILSLSTGWRSVLPLGMILAFTASILLTYNFGRMRLGMMPLWLLLAGHAAVWLVRSFRSPEPLRRRRGAAALLAVLLLSAAAFYPLLAADFELSNRKQIARLAMRAGNDALAEEHLRVILQKLETIAVEESASQQYLVQIATIHQLLAEVYGRSQRYELAVDQLQQVRKLPIRDDARDDLLQFNATLLRSAADEASQSADREAIAKELSTTLAELQQR